jgi:hypothetical protein
MSLTNDFETSVLTWLLTASSPSPARPTAWYIGLFTAAPGESGGGTEVSGGSYVREAVTFTVSGDTASNNAAIEWPTATGDWGTISHIAVFDAATSGNMLVYGALTAAKAIDTGDVFRIPSGDLDITLN